MAADREALKQRARNADRTLHAEEEKVRFVVEAIRRNRRPGRPDAPYLVTYHEAEAVEILHAIETARELIALLLRGKST